MAQYPEFDIITSIRYDDTLFASRENNNHSSIGPQGLYMLDYHRDRLLAAAQAFGRSIPSLEGKAGVQHLAKIFHDHLESDHDISDLASPLKLRLNISPENLISITSTTQTLPVPQSALFPDTLSPSTGPTYHVFISPLRTSPDLFTLHKTSHRPQYDTVRALLSPSEADDLASEILLVNQEGNIMEGSITTPYFCRGEIWVTPASSCGGNLGTTRRWALDQGLCQEGTVDVETVKAGEIVVLSNGVRGFGWGKVKVLP